MIMMMMMMMMMVMMMMMMMMEMIYITMILTRSCSSRSKKKMTTATTANASAPADSPFAASQRKTYLGIAWCRTGQSESRIRDAEAIISHPDPWCLKQPAGTGGVCWTCPPCTGDQSSCRSQSRRSDNFGGSGCDFTLVGIWAGEGFTVRLCECFVPAFCMQQGLHCLSCFFPPFWLMTSIAYHVIIRNQFWKTKCFWTLTSPDQDFATAQPVFASMSSSVPQSYTRMFFLYLFCGISENGSETYRKMGSSIRIPGQVPRFGGSKLGLESQWPHWPRVRREGGFHSHGGTLKCMVYEWTSHLNGWFKGNPILGTPQIINWRDLKSSSKWFVILNGETDGFSGPQF